MNQSTSIDQVVYVCTCYKWFPCLLQVLDQQDALIGYNAATDKYENLLTAGIIDPAKVKYKPIIHIHTHTHIHIRIHIPSNVNLSPCLGF